MAKKLEHKNIKFETYKKEGNYIMELIRLFREVRTKTDEAEQNKISMKDALGRRILF